jgi:hypothetical protein
MLRSVNGADITIKYRSQPQLEIELHQFDLHQMIENSTMSVGNPW